MLFKKRKINIKKGILILGSLICLLFLWNFIAQFYNPKLFPKVQNIFAAFKGVVVSKETYLNLFASFALVLRGFILSIIIAFPVSIICFKSQLFSKIIIPYHEFIRYIPVPAFVPLCAAIFGIGDLTKVMLVFIGTYFQVLFMFIADFEVASKGYEESAKTLGLKGIDLILKINIPSSLPGILDSIRITFAWAWSYLLVAEVVNSQYGIGYLVLQSYRVLNMPRLISYLIIIGFFGLFMDYLFKAIRIKICPYLTK